VILYSTTIFAEMLDTPSDSTSATEAELTLGVGLTAVIFNMIGGIISNKFGRRPLLLIGEIFAAVINCLLILCSALSL